MTILHIVVRICIGGVDGIPIDFRVWAWLGVDSFSYLCYL